MGTRPNHASHWVSEVIDSEWPVAISNPLLASVVRFGSFPNLFFLVIVLVQPSQVPQRFFNAIFFAVVWLNVGPALIWYYDERVLPTFFAELAEIVRDEQRIRELSGKYDRIFSSWYWLPTVLWLGLIAALFFATQSSLAATGLFTVGGPFYYVYLVSALWLGLFTGIGFMGVVTTVLAIREIAGEPLRIDPLHPDDLGGLSVVGYYAIRTTLTFSSGSLLLPLSSIFVRGTDAGWLIYLIVVCYTGAIALSFIYPTYIINRQAQRIRDETLDQLRRKYQNAKREMRSAGTLSSAQAADGSPEQPDQGAESFRNHGEVEELVGHLELQRIRNEYQDYQSVRLYPFQIDILIKLASSILLPALFILFDQALDFVL